MSFEQPGFMLGFLKADADYSNVAASQYTAVDLGPSTQTSGTGQGKASAIKPTAGGLIVGIVQNNPSIGMAVTIMQTGVSMAKMSGTGNSGDVLAVDANGMFLKATTGQYGVARAIEGYTPGATSTVLLEKLGKQ